MFGLEPWQRASATVVARRLLKEWSNHNAPGLPSKSRKYEFVLDVSPADGSPRFRASCTSSWASPVQGDTVRVLAKPGREKVKFDKKRAGGTRKKPQRSAEEDARWERMLEDEPGSVPPRREDG